MGEELVDRIGRMELEETCVVLTLEQAVERLCPEQTSSTFLNLSTTPPTLFTLPSLTHTP